MSNANGPVLFVRRLVEVDRVQSVHLGKVRSIYGRWLPPSQTMSGQGRKVMDHVGPQDLVEHLDHVDPVRPVDLEDLDYLDNVEPLEPDEHLVLVDSLLQSGAPRDNEDGGVR